MFAIMKLFGRGGKSSEKHLTLPNGDTEEASHSPSAMGISIGGTSQRPTAKIEPVEDSIVVVSPVGEVATFKEDHEPGHVTQIGGTANETPIKKTPAPNVAVSGITCANDAEEKNISVGWGEHKDPQWATIEERKRFICLLEGTPTCKEEQQYILHPDLLLWNQ